MEEAHPGEKFDMNWNLSLDYIAGDTDDGELDYKMSRQNVQKIWYKNVH